MKYPNTGIYHFCKELGNALVRQDFFKKGQLCFYVPPNDKGIFGINQTYILQNPIHKFWPVQFSNDTVWHSTYQLSSYLPPKKRGLKIVATIHDLNFLHDGKVTHKHKKYLKQIQNLINKADSIVTISHFVKNDILNRLNIKGKQIEVIYNGCNKPAIDVFQRPPGDFSKPFFFSIGTIARKKNFHVLPAMLLNNDYELIIAGITQEEDYKRQIISTAAKLGVEQRVRMIGTISDSEKYWLLKNCAAFCFPSISEGFGLPVIEAMQFGTPVIISKSTSLPEIGGPHAIYLENFDFDTISETTTRFLNDTTTEKERQALVDWAAHFDWDITAGKYRDIYNSIS